MKVLHLISGGDTGGAKTHIMALLGELKNNIDISLGVFIEDVFLEEARELGINTVVFEQKSRVDLSVLNLIKEYIIDNKIDLVHCHGARANFIAMFLMSRVQVPFVTTVHSDPRLDFKGNLYKQLIFKNLHTFALKRFKNFITVSDSFRNMLVERGFGKKNIDVLYNGIDLKKKENMVSREEFLDRYNIPNNGLKIGIMARLEEVKDHKTFLRAAAEFLKTNDADFLIGGGGALLDELRELASELKIEDKVYFLGEVKDPHSFMNAIDINVLSSLSESFPYVILEGGKHHLPMIATEVGGIPKLIKDDITGYLFKPGDYKNLAKHLLNLAHDENKRKELGDNLYNAIEKDYSSEAMAIRQLEIYERILYGKSIVLSGFYGFDNQGDDAILEAITTELRRLDPSLRLMVLSNNPNKTREIYNVESSYRFNPFNVIATIKRSDMLISGGGSLLQDVTSTRSLWYYLFVIRLSKFFGKKTVIYANGVGPINKKINRRRTMKTLKDLDLITLRDDDSGKYLEEMGIGSDKYLVRSDPVFLLEPDISSATNILNKIGIGEDFIAINLRPWKDDSKVIEAFKGAIKRLLAKGEKILLMPMHYPTDLNILDKIYDDIDKSSVDTSGLFIYKDEMSVRELMGIFSLSKLVISMRLHGLIYSVSVHTKPLAISYDPKVNGFMNEIKSDYLINLDDIRADKLYDMIEKAIADDKYLDRLLIEDDDRKNLAKQNAIEVLDVLNGDNYERQS
ncbi:MAG: polysaccharide pyruvyl transferase CsaB [Firmicutes bacterium]|nr:polysaccharide pyruvyl transferase CsaB [Ezakiella sp.]MDD7762128.1 polysaccharide pyruvyl transferase CsaB [Bacillota bacterium]